MREWLSDPQHLEDAAKAEHERWVSFVCSMGWRHASLSQMRSYLDRGNPRQQLYLARLHLCIVSWQRLPQVQKEYNDMRRLRDPDWKDRDLIGSDYKIVKVMADILNG